MKTLIIIPTYNERQNIEPLFEAILKYVAAPKGDPTKPFKMLVTTLDFDAHKGKIAIGNVTQGSVKKGDTLLILDENIKRDTFKVEEVLTSKGLKRIPTDIGETGDIIAIIGGDSISIGQTLADPSDPTGFPKMEVEENETATLNSSIRHPTPLTRPKVQ